MDPNALRKLAEKALKAKKKPFATTAGQFDTQYQQPPASGFNQGLSQPQQGEGRQIFQPSPGIDQGLNLATPTQDDLATKLRQRFTPKQTTAENTFRHGIANPGTIAPADDGSPEYMTKEEWDAITGAKDINDIMNAFAPKPKEDQIGYQKRIAKMNALGNALGSIGSLISASMGGPVQTQDRSSVHDPMNKVLALENEHENEKRAHELMILQNEIANRRGYGDYVVGEKRRQEDYQQALEQLYAKWQQEDRVRLQKEDHDHNMQAARSGDARTLQAQRDQEANKRASVSNASRERAAAIRANEKNAQTHTIYDPMNKNKELYSLNGEQKTQLENIVLSELGKRFDKGERFDARTEEILQNRQNINADDRWMLAQQYYNLGYNSLSFLEGKDIQKEKRAANSEAMAGTFVEGSPAAARKMAADALVRKYKISQEEADELATGATPEQIRDLIRK